MKTSKIEFTRVNNDVNGNPRYVCHFFDLLTKEDSEELSGKISEQYKRALNNSRQFGGKKFHNKQYGGGIVFQSYNIQGLEKDILEFTGR